MEIGECEKHRNHGKHQSDDLKYSICNGSKHSICDPNTLFYGITAWRRLKNHYICVWKTWAWVSSRLENVKWLGEACAILWQVSNHPNRILDIFTRQYTIFLDFLFFLKDLPSYYLKTEKSMVPKVAPYLPEWPKKAGGRLTDGEKWQFFLGLRRRGQHRPRHTECVLYAPLVAWWWPGCTRAR